MIKKLINGTCAKCGNKVDYFVLENESTNLTLTSYNSFKRPLINTCPYCGYINDDLSENNELYQRIKLNLIEPNNSLKINLLNNIKVARAYLKSLIAPDKKIRVLANIFENNKMLLNNFLVDNYTKNDETTHQVFTELKTNLLNSANEILNLTESENFDNDFVNILKIEVLCCVNKTDIAKKMLNSFKNLSPDLFDYLDDCLIMGGHK